MATVCETCGDVGYEHLLLSCGDCKCAMHQYCLAKVLFDGSSLERWFCNQCLPRHGEVASLHKASNHSHSGSTVRQASTTHVESTKEARPYRNHKNRSKRSKSKSRRKKYSSRKNSLLRKHTQERSDMRPVGDKANRGDCNASNISCASGKALHSCEVIAVEISKASKDENKQVDDEYSVRTMNNDCVANRLLTKINESNLQKPLEEFEPPQGAVEELNPTRDTNCMSSGNVETEYRKGCCVTTVLAMESQNEPSTLLDCADSNSLSETTLKQDVLLEASDTVVDLSDTVRNCVNDNPRKRRQLILLDDDDDEEEAAIEYPKGCCVTPVLAMENQNEPSTLLDRPDSNSLSETTLKQDVLLEASDTVVDLSDTVQNYVNENPRKRRQLILLDDDDDEEEAAIEYPKGYCMTPVLAMENQNEPSTLVDGADSNSLPETCLKQDVLVEASDTVVELSDTVHKCVNDNPRKRRRLILLDDDDDEEEAADVQSEDFNHRSLECDGSLKKHKIVMEDCVEETAHTQNLNGQNLGAVNLDILIPESSEITQPVKKQRSYTKVNEDDEDGEVIVGTSNVECALNNVLKFTSETLVAKHDALQSRIEFDSESVNQQRCMYSQPIDEPIWSGILKINNGAFVSLAAHISTKACGLVWELSTSLQPVVEVIKLPQLEAWPKSWKASGPTDDDIALYFFPPSMSPNEESDVLVEEIIDSCAVMKAVVGVAELLIFPSTILPEQYHVCQDKHYLWGVFKRREDKSDKDVLVEEQDASALVEEGEIQEHHFMDQQSGVQCESPDLGTSVVKHAVHVEDQLLTEHNCEAQDGATKATMGEGLVSPGNNSSSVKLNLPEARSNCFMQPRSDPILYAPEEVDHREDEQNFTRPSADLGPAATSAKSVFSVEPGEVPPTRQLFGFVAARTPRAQQLIQEMVSEGARLFSVGEDIVTVGSTVGNDTGAQVHPTPDGECPPMQERCQSIGFVPLDDDMASDACLELFPVRQEHIGRTPRVEEASKEVDLDLSLSARSGTPLGSFL
ncbi:unnamed protein product [Alopecurus aequalis]